jgi:hypothetical protein
MERVEAFCCLITLIGYKCDFARSLSTVSFHKACDEETS